MNTVTYAKEAELIENDTELSEDIEVIGPGQMLREARENIGLSQEQVAERLNFRLCLVNDIEHENFDKSLAPTFNRGYLRNYAKLVKVSEQDILNGYEMLDIVERHCAEMQSFSKSTIKQAENKRIMWISYLILAIIAGSTVIWWYQDTSQTSTTTINDTPNEIIDNIATSVTTLTAENAENSLPVENIDSTEVAFIEKNATSDVDNIIIQPKDISSSSPAEIGPLSTINEVNNTQPLETTTQALVELINVTFTFSGDCWVNIYDGSGERLAWGVKKSGYVMNIKGREPFSVTLGKPELVSIQYGDTPVDMSKFAVGNIAKFNLPNINN
jgi:cytoskeleton protein RodZ